MGKMISNCCQLQKPDYLTELPKNIYKQWQIRDRVKLVAAAVLVVVASLFALSAFGYCLQASIIGTTFKISSALLFGMLSTFLYDESKNSYRSPDVPFLGHQNNGENICFLNALLACLWGLDGDNSVKEFLQEPGEKLKDLGDYFKKYQEDLNNHDKGYKYCTKGTNDKLRTLFFPGSTRNSQEDPNEVLHKLSEEFPDHLKTTVTTVRRFVVPEGTPLPQVADEEDQAVGVMRLNKGNYEQLVVDVNDANRAEQVTGLYVHQIAFDDKDELNFEQQLNKEFYGEYNDEQYAVRLTRPNDQGGETEYLAYQEKLIDRLPKVFPVRINRYSQDGKKLAESKLTNVVKEFTFKKSWGPNEDGEYQLKAFQCHSGNTSRSGHYYSFVKHGEDWFMCNDEVVKKVSQDTVNSYLEKKSYLLFFEKEED